VSRRLPQLVVLCEDRQHDAFCRDFFYAQGWTRHQIRVEKCPTGKQAAEQWVRQRYPIEVGTLRAHPHIYRALVVVRDGDMAGVAVRQSELDQALAAQGLAQRAPREPITLVVPCRNIETWLAYLGGSAVDELTKYPKLAHERECAPRAAELKSMCDRGALRQPAPPSLERACDEYRTRLEGSGR
jgi:hypothetical protein